MSTRCGLVEIPEVASALCAAVILAYEANQLDHGVLFIRNTVAKPIVSDPIDVDVPSAPIAAPIVVADGLDSGVRREGHSPVVMGHFG